MVGLRILAGPPTGAQNHHRVLTDESVFFLFGTFRKWCIMP